MLFTYFVLISIYPLILMMFHSTQKERIETKEGRRMNWQWRSWGLLNIKDHAPFCVLHSGKSIIVLLINALLPTISHQSPPSFLEVTATCRDDGSSIENLCYRPVYSLRQHETKTSTGGGGEFTYFYPWSFIIFIRHLFSSLYSMRKEPGRR